MKHFTFVSDDKRREYVIEIHDNRAKILEVDTQDSRYVARQEVEVKNG